MNIAINLLKFVVGGSGGVETYVKELISRIGHDKRYENITLFILMDEKSEIFFKTAENVRVIRIKKLSNTLLLLLDKIFKKLIRNFDYETRQLKRIIDKYDIDIIHYPFSVITNFNINIPTVLSVMDIQQEYHPEFFSKEDLSSRKGIYKLSCERADKIIAISNFTKRTISEKYKIEPFKIRTAYLGSEMTERKKAVKGLPCDFIFYPAGMWPHKNHKNLFKAIKILIENYNFNPKLVLTGVKIKNERNAEKFIKANNIEQNVIILGYLSPEEISYIYSKAKLLVFPSLFEGFGIPVLEAMKVGLPVACSNITSLPEIVEDAAILFDPHNPEEIAKAISKIYSDKAIRASLVGKELKQAKRFSWDKTAADNIEVYKEVLKKFRKK